MRYSARGLALGGSWSLLRGLGYREPVSRPAWLALLGATACAPLSSVELPTEPGLKSYLVVAVRDLSGELFAYALPDTPAALPSTFSAGTSVVVFGYDRSLEEMAIVPRSGSSMTSGAFPVAIADDLPRPIPVQADLLWGSSEAGFAKLSVPPPSLAQARLEGFALACGRRSGCPELSEGEEHCNLACRPDAPAPPALPAPPSPPALPLLTPCPSSWTSVSATISSQPDHTALARCVPPPQMPPPRCGPGEAAFFGGSGCAPVGVACPAAGFDPLVLADLYVDQSAAPGGDGSRLAPLVDLDRAIALLAQRGLERIAVARGDYVFSGLSVSGAEIIGACAEHTRLLLGPRSQIAAPSRLSQLTLVGLDRPASFALEVVSPGTLALESVVVEDVSGPSLGVGYSTVSLDRVALRGAQRGALSLNRAHSTLSAVAISDLRGHAIQVFSGQTQISQLAIHRLRSDPAERRDAVGVVGWDAKVSIEDATISDLEGVAVYVTGSSLSLARAQIDDVRPVAPPLAVPTSGSGISVFSSTATISESSITRVRSSGITAYFASRLQVHRSILSDPGPGSVAGVICAVGSRCTLKQTEIAGRSNAVVASDSPDLRLEDVLIDGRGLSSTVTAALNVFDGTRATFSRVVSAGSAHSGLNFEGGEVALADLWVDHLGGGPIAPFGLSLRSSTTSLERARVAGGDHLISIEGGAASLTDLELGYHRFLNLYSAAFYHLYGALSLERLRVHHAEDVAFDAQSPSRLRIQDLDVEGVRRAPSSPNAAIIIAWSPLGARSAAEIDRVRVRGAENVALAVEDISGELSHRIRDVAISGSTDACDTDPVTTPGKCGAIDLRGSTRAVGERWQVDGQGIRLLRISTRVHLSATDLRFSGGVSSMLVAMEDSPVVELERFWLEGGGVCLYYDGPDGNDVPALRLRDGRFRCPMSFETGCQFDGLEALSGVLVDDVQGLTCDQPLLHLGR